MNTIRSTATGIAILFVATVTVPAITITPVAPGPSSPPMQGTFSLMAFRDRPEANMLQRAYEILATGDHDYKGHRVKAMHAVKAAADLLGYDLGGDDRYKEKQALSDDKLREARDLLKNVLGAAEVKDQKRISKHIEGAIRDINTALKIK